MKFLADFHIHSKYSYATSKFMDLQALATWGQLKGLTVMGTGDFTHPLWRKELREQVHEVEVGLFALQPKLQATVDAAVYTLCRGLQRFLLTAEVSTVFRRSGKCYKVHSIIFAPSFDVAEKIAIKLAAIGNVSYDGRPTLGLDVLDLLKIIMDISPDCMLVPAHIWTPHFGLLGFKSGFDSFQECFGDYSQYIYAFEKGLSSSFAMNAQVSALDRFSILSNSDAHSVQNLGREANLFDTDLSYGAMMHAIKNKDSGGLVAGIEFFPEMGKYYASGHRECEVYAMPEQTAVNQKCSVCGKLLTIGVAHRVDQLADRTIEQSQKFIWPHYRIAPLQVIIAQSLGVKVGSVKITKIYNQLLADVGNEFYILLYADLVEIAAYSTITIAQSIDAVRKGKVFLKPGYDGVYGKIKFEK